MKKKLAALNSRLKRFLSGVDNKKPTQSKNDSPENGNKIINHPKLNN